MNSDWRAKLRNGMESLLDQAVASGAKQADVFKAAIDAIDRLRIGNEHDPVPADDVSEKRVEEPANDWSAASA